MEIRISIAVNVILFIIVCLLLFGETQKKKRENLKKLRSNAVIWLIKIHASKTIEQLDVVNNLIEKDFQYFTTVLPVHQVNHEFNLVRKTLRDAIWRARTKKWSEKDLK